MSSYDYNTSDTRISMEYWKSISDEDRVTSTQYPRLSTITSSVASAPVNVTSSTLIPSGSGNLLEGLIVPLYATIFLLAVIGNSLVLVTLARNKRMRTVTNVYLLNLAVSDLLLGVFCMPFTLLGQMLKNFVFGTTMCKLIPYFQAVSVSVGVWTLVAISLERYFAICRPLKSRRWQTQFHAYKMIAVVWAGSLTWNAPILAVSRLKAIRGGRHKCREEWPSIGSERAYNLFLDGMLLLLPLVVMILAYSLIVTKLWRGLRREIKHSSTCQRQLERIGSSATVNGITANSCNDDAGDAKTNVVTLGRQQTLLPLPGCPLQGVSATLVRKNRTSDVARPRRTETVKRWLMKGMIQRFQGRGTTSGRVSTCRNDATLQTRSPAGYENGIQVRIDRGGPAHGHEETNNFGSDEQQNTTYTFSRHAIRSNYMEKSIEAKKKVIRMLFVVVLEFFVCWAPLHVVNTWCLFSPELVYSLIGSTGISLVQLLAYISSCCNPITYCFMNRKFRQAFLGVFDCYRCWSISCGSGDEDASAGTTRNATQAGNSELSGNDSTIYLGRTSLVARSGNSSDDFLPVRSEITRVAILLQKWCSWRRRIVFSSGYGMNNGLPGPSGSGPSTSGVACPVGAAMSGSLSSNRPTAASLCVDLEPEEENFLLRISWRPPPPLSPALNQNVNGNQKIAGYSHSALQLHSSGYSCTDDLKFLYD